MRCASGWFKRAVILAALINGSPVAAQSEQRYTPTLRRPQTGHEIVLIFISSSQALENENPRFDGMVRSIKRQLAAKAAAANTSFCAIGVSLDWSPDVGAEFLLRGKSRFGVRDFDPWDEIHVGRNWLNELIIRYVWRDHVGPAGVSQMVVVERTINPAALDDGPEPR